MNEVVLDQPGVATDAGKDIPKSRSSRKSNAFYGYAFTILAIAAGWLLRGAEYVTPKNGVGYWLGIVGGSLMLVLLLYPLRKRLRLLRIFGSTAHWFRIHMILGIVGPLLVLFHSNFQLGSFNSRVAMFCMLLVAGSGVIGRHIYARIHRGLYGEKTNLQEVQKDLTESLEKSHGLATLMPSFAAELERISSIVQGDKITGALGTRASLRWAVQKYYFWWRLRQIALHELQVRTMSSETIAKDFPRLKAATTTYIRRFIRLTSRVAQFTLYERLFSLWHVLHLPLFFMMVISALVHVLAVHMY